jgi:hypothetical protein
MARQQFHRFECGSIEVMDLGFPVSIQTALHGFLEALWVFDNDPVALGDFLSSLGSTPDWSVLDLDFSGLSEAEVKKGLLLAMESVQSTEVSSSTLQLLYLSNITALFAQFMLNQTPLGKLINSKESVALFHRSLYKLQLTAINSNQSLIELCEENWDSSVDAMFQNKVTPELSQFGTGSYPFCSLLNHSCIENVRKVAWETKMCVVVVRPIKAGGQIFLNYG